MEPKTIIKSNQKGGANMESAKQRIDNQENKINKIALDLFNRCKDENLSVYEFNLVINQMCANMKHGVTMQGPLSS